MRRWVFLKTCSMDAVSTGFMICSWVCPASSSKNEEEFGVLTWIPIQHQVILWSHIIEIGMRGSTLFVLPLYGINCQQRMVELDVLKLKYLPTALINFSEIRTN